MRPSVILAHFGPRAAVTFVTIVSILSVVPGSALAAKGSKPSDKLLRQLLQVEKDWSQAIVQNDADAAGRFMTDDWVVVDAEGIVLDKATFLGVIKSGALTHDRMELGEPRVRVYKDTAVVTGRATSAGKYMGAAFTTDERSTDVFVKQKGKWRCVMTQLTRIAPRGGN